MVLYKFVECGEADWILRRSVLSVSKSFDVQASGTKGRNNETIAATITDNRIVKFRTNEHFDG